MLSRRLIRAKVLQEIYAFITAGNDDLLKGERALDRSFDKLYELYIYQVSMLLAIHDYALKRIDENRVKLLPTEDDLNPNLKFIENKVLLLLKENRDLQNAISTYKVSWTDEEDMVRKLYVFFIESKGYNEYMSTDNSSFEEDVVIVTKLVKNQLSNSDLLKDYYEERNIYWVDDFYIANFLVIKMVKQMDSSNNEFTHLPGLFVERNAEEKNDDQKFYTRLFRRTILNSTKLQEEIAEKVKNWEMDRIATIDVIILKMALTELTEFPSIPVNVTMNEYIDLSKMFSTPKSSGFINGVLDRMIKDYKERKLIKKTGRGLL